MPTCVGSPNFEGNKGERFFGRKVGSFFFNFNFLPGVFPPTSFGWNSCRVEVDFLGAGNKPKKQVVEMRSKKKPFLLDLFWVLRGRLGKTSKNKSSHGHFFSLLKKSTPKVLKSNHPMPTDVATDQLRNFIPSGRSASSAAGYGMAEPTSREVEVCPPDKVVVRPLPFPGRWLVLGRDIFCQTLGFPETLQEGIFQHRLLRCAH